MPDSRVKEMRGTPSRLHTLHDETINDRWTRCWVGGPLVSFVKPGFERYFASMTDGELRPNLMLLRCCQYGIQSNLYSYVVLPRDYPSLLQHAVRSGYRAVLASVAAES